MVNNCLVTKFNGRVDIENPQYFNKFHFIAKTWSGPSGVLSGRQQVKFTTNELGGIHISTKGNGFFTNVQDPSSQYYIPMTELDVPASTSKSVYFSDGDYDVFVEGKCNLESMEIGGLLTFDIEQLSFSNFTGTIKVECPQGNLNNIENAPLAAILNLSPSTDALKARADLRGDIAVIKDITSLTTLNVLNNLNITGGIGSLGSLTSLTELNFNATRLHGNIEDFVSAQIANGRSSVTTSSPIYAHRILGQAYFGGSLRGGKINQWITWESASKIIVYASETTTFADYTDVYAKGATAEEISAWESAGKTVTVIS